MTLIYTEHALARLAKRQLKQEWIERAVSGPSLIVPDTEDPALEHRFAAIAELDNRVLRVIVSVDEPRRVVSAYIDRRMKGKI